ncbi:MULTISPECIES: MATE family efflux transporter [unclassified Fusibacter]|uniref:MATE family efflux transporter n=1 Tax=unclassified Fusibacter TaxID=2624464 RepID=UPI0010113508|nr:MULTISPECIES: MATE family efflux transporter [unclassified Fusibacter]MCK8058476.1 MATE family efflux transporter [Fusibacter sp. A2]NPE22756.1 MATE family efflux transporter [Fusibacter sp. A1]RXV60314.1 MATE family efflux transporter [Fusibacter sp. A1]
MATTKRRDLTTGDIKQTLTTLTLPMIFGVLGIVAFNLADTYFVGKLGTSQMAALTFTFPVVLVFNSINHGIGIGASAIISRAVGEHDTEKVVRLSTDSLSLGVVFAIIAMTIGLTTIEPLFTLLGADQSVMPYIKEYMSIWYMGVPFIVIPMIGNNAIRALGDTKTPSIVMMVAAGANILLDPILIFGWGFIPASGVSGAATATVLARMITFAVSLYVLIIREKVISLKVIHYKELIDSWKKILYIGLPNAVSKVIMPIGLGIITGLVATFGTTVVAGYGIASRIEYFALTLVSALSSVIPVFVGQNFGAGKIDRIKKGILSSEKFSALSGIVTYALLFILAKPIAGLFTDQAQVTDTIVLYLRIVPIGYAFQGAIMIFSGALNALNRPIKAAMLNLVQMLLIYVPLALISSSYLGVIGIFVSLIVSYVIVGIGGHITLHKDIDRLSAEASYHKNENIQ